MVMQNLDIVHGRPSWRAQFLIGTVNSCGRFSAIRYEFFGEKDKDSWGCRAWAVEKSTDEKLVGPDISIALAKAEGWHDKKGSKWKTMPQLMLMYRAGAWWTRAYAPELSLGIRTAEEEDDIIDITARTVDTAQADTMKKAAAQLGANQKLESAVTEVIDAETGEITETKTVTDEEATDVIDAEVEEIAKSEPVTLPGDFEEYFEKVAAQVREAPDEITANAIDGSVNTSIAGAVERNELTVEQADLFNGRWNTVLLERLRALQKTKNGKGKK